MNGHPHMLLERRAALARVAHDLHQMLAYLRDAHYNNQTFALGLDLPGEKPLIEAIGACVAAHHRTEEDRHAPRG